MIDEQMLMSMAGDILSSRLRWKISAPSGRQRASPVQQRPARSPQLPAGEFEKLTDSVMHEAEVDMAKNRDAIVNYIANPQAPELLEDVSAGLSPSLEPSAS